MSHNLVLIGYRGTGKSTVASILGAQMKRPVYVMDEIIVERAGKTISEIVQAEGWEGFRARETALANELGALSGVVIDSGGGIVTRPENITALKRNGVLIWLTADVETIIERIRSSSDRPALNGSSFIDEVPRILVEREPLYEAAADGIVNTVGRTPEEAAEDALALYQSMVSPS